MEQKLIYAINILWSLISNWWWLLLPFIFYRPFLFFWRWWRLELWSFAQKKVLLEIKIPQEVLKPLRSMEQVFTAIWGNVFDPPDWFEKWFEGKDLDSVQLEIVSLEGEAHFYIRCSDFRRKPIESSIYSQYPEAEISVADDYTKYVPQDLPNKDWDLWGTDFQLDKSDVYPIKTYSKFFEEKTEAKEEKRVDPMSTLLEGMGKMGPGEQLWIQIAISPVSNKENDFVKRGLEVVSKLAKRPVKSKQKSIFLEAADVLISGKAPGEKKEEEPVIPVEMRMTPGERDIVAGVEGKISQRGFVCFARFIYLAKRDVYFGGAKGIPFGFFNQFATENLNQIRPYVRTLTKIKKYITFLGLSVPIFEIMRGRRTFIKKRRLFFRYIKRFPPLFPKLSAPPSNFLLDTEELATIFHFPGHTVAPAPFVSRVETKRGEAPPGLPME